MGIEERSGRHGALKAGRLGEITCQRSRSELGQRHTNMGHNEETRSGIPCAELGTMEKTALVIGRRS